MRIGSAAVIVIVLGIIVLSQANRFDAQERYYRGLELERQARLADSLVWADQALGVAVRLIPAAIVLVAGVGLAVVVVVAAWRRWASWQSVRADAVIRLAEVQTRALAARAGPAELPARETVALLGASLAEPARKALPALPARRRKEHER